MATVHLLLWTIMCICTSVNGYKVLMFPVNMRSHLIVSGRFAEALIQNGHEAHLLVPTNKKASPDLDPRVKTLSFNVAQDIPWISSQEAFEIEWDMVYLAQTNFLEWARIGIGRLGYVFTKLNQDCEQLLASSYMIEKLSRENYDLIVLD